MIGKIKELAARSLKLRKYVISILVITAITAGSVFAATTSSYSVNIIDEGREFAVKTLKSSPEGIIAQADIVLGENDLLDISAFKAGEDSVISILRARTVSVKFGEEDAVSVSAVGTVADAMDEAGIILGENDLLTPAADTALTDGMEIRVDSVSFHFRTEKKVIAYGSRTETDPEIYTGESRIKTKGVNGEEEISYKETFVNGKLTDVAEEGRTLVAAAIDEVKLVGGKKRVQAINLKSDKVISTLAPAVSINFDENGLPINYSNIIEGRAAAYTGGGRTATGKPARTGYVAVNPKVIPYGTKLYIVSLDGKYVYGYAEAADTGGFAQKGYYTVDLYMDTVSECYQWGDRGVRIYVLEG